MMDRRQARGLDLFICEMGGSASGLWPLPVLSPISGSAQSQLVPAPTPATSDGIPGMPWEGSGHCPGHTVR